MTTDIGSATILLLPGLNNSGEGHWQTLWEKMLPNAHRVDQDEWDAPSREAWVEQLDTVIKAATTPVILVAHSLGCMLAVWWAQQHGQQAHANKVKGALLVALPDVEREEFPKDVRGFAPVPQSVLPFKSIVVASADDPWGALPRAQSWAAAWDADFHDIGARGHINSTSGLGDWPQGRVWLEQLVVAKCT